MPTRARSSRGSFWQMWAKACRKAWIQVDLPLPARAGMMRDSRLSLARISRVILFQYLVLRTTLRSRQRSSRFSITRPVSRSTWKEASASKPWVESGQRGFRRSEAVGGFGASDPAIGRLGADSFWAIWRLGEILAGEVPCFFRRFLHFFLLISIYLLQISFVLQLNLPLPPASSPAKALPGRQRFCQRFCRGMEADARGPPGRRCCPGSRHCRGRSGTGSRRREL